MPKNVAPALNQKLANADAKARPIMDKLAEWGASDEDVLHWVALLNRHGFTAPRGGPVTYNVVIRALERLRVEGVN